MNAKSKARMEMLKKMSKDKSGDLHSELGKALGGKKKLQKVEVIAPDKESLEEGLSMAQKLMKAKFGDKLEKGEAPSKKDAEEAIEEHACPICEDEGCSECSEEEGEEEPELESIG